jgi:hypothetical protein
MGGHSCRRRYPGLHHGTVDQELLLRNEYLAAENRVLGGKLKGRRRKRRTELLHRGSLHNCHLCDRFNFLTIRVRAAAATKNDAVIPLKLGH